MLRYLKAVQMMKQVIEENNLTVMATVARYACAYEKIAKPDWWDKSRRYGHVNADSCCPQCQHIAVGLSSSKEHISATCLDILVVKWTYRP